MPCKYFDSKRFLVVRVPGLDKVVETGDNSIHGASVTAAIIIQAFFNFDFG